ncbi:putative peptidase YuxL [Sporosarcina sp. NCCP-2716]|uniref:S9 family peptidase n=1 Tax=Sporosarcina sp. NCCP-2716 TaxID=2943679 RepID=UPI00203B9D0D|nr:S9 family peptidase [Sporosarcina sp. NCCP-2716]GKV69387.1 putative peptidase YuxL [Sporosarcina sp. NCCP-2716]
MTTKQTVQKDDLFKLKSVTNPVLSPDGTEAVFIVTQIDKDENAYHAHLHHLDFESGKSTQWTFGKERVSKPQWSPDGSQIAFLSTRSDKNQLYVMQATGGEARRLTEYETGVSDFLWSPCGTKIWLSGTLEDGKTFTDKAKKDEEKDKKNPEALRVTTMKYKMDGAGFVKQDRHSQIGCLELTTGDITQFTDGPHHHSLEAVSHDGKKLVIGVNRAENKDFDFRQPLVLTDIETKEETVLVDEQGYFGGAAFSLDDRYIAYGGSNRSFENATHGELYVYDCEEKTTLTLTEGLDAPLGDAVVADHQQGPNPPEAVWTEGNYLYFTVSVMGDVRLYFADLDGSLYPASPEGEHIYDYDVAKNGQFALAAITDPVNPGELYKLDIATGDRTAMTSFNETYVTDTVLVQPETVQFDGANGFTVHGWLMKPATFKEGETYPLVVNVHGGPHAMYGNSFFHEMQVLAAQGWGVLYVNPRGSHGYSQGFVDAVRGDYGGGDYKDIMDALDHVLADNDWIDTDRLGVTGGSYGGFMTNWIVGHTDRFKAAVTQRSISNWISFFGVSDIGYYFSDWQINADMTDVDTLWKHSPLKYAENVKTPLLILHSENDLRCPIEQAEQLYITLKSMGKTTEFVRFPEADHNLSRTGKPNLRITRLDEITGWFDKYLK